MTLVKCKKIDQTEDLIEVNRDYFVKSLFEIAGTGELFTSLEEPGKELPIGTIRYCYFSNKSATWYLETDIIPKSK